MKSTGPAQPLTWFWFSGCLQHRLPTICTKQLLNPNAGWSCMSPHCVETDRSANFCTAEKLFSPILPRLCILFSNTTIQNHRKSHHSVYASNHTGVQWPRKYICDGRIGFPQHVVKVCSIISKEHTASIFRVTICFRYAEVNWESNPNQPHKRANYGSTYPYLGLWHGHIITSPGVVLALTTLPSRQVILTWSC
jgi:hypothetical protein